MKTFAAAIYVLIGFGFTLGLAEDKKFEDRNIWQNTIEGIVIWPIVFGLSIAHYNSRIRDSK